MVPAKRGEGEPARAGRDPCCPTWPGVEGPDQVTPHELRAGISATDTPVRVPPVLEECGIVRPFQAEVGQAPNFSGTFDHTGRLP